MNIWLTVVLIVHVIVALGIVGLVLLQHGKGADMGAAFGGGSSGSLFGATGSANFLSRTTAVLATIFFITSLSLAYLATHKPRADGGVMDSAPVPAVPSPSGAPGDAAPAPRSADPTIPVPSTGANETEKPRTNEAPK
jgi:preprotein translocase subunit SecG